MPLPVRLQDVVEAIERADDEWTFYINRVTGEIVSVTDEDARRIERNDCIDKDLPDWHAEALTEARGALESPDFVALPGQFEVHEWQLMEQFAMGQPGALREELLRAIHGSGAFRRFKSAVRRLGVEQAWYHFRDGEFERIAREWLEAEGIAYVSQPLER